MKNISKLLVPLIVVFNLLSTHSFAQKIRLLMSLDEVIETARDQSPSALVAKHNCLASY